MNDIPISALLGLLFLLILFSAFFSSSETGMMTLNRYRLRHKAQSGNKNAQRAQRLLDRPDRLLGVILIGNNFVNILASSIATIIAIRLFGDAGIAYATGILTLVVLVFAEVTPKTLAALKPEKIAYPASVILMPLLWLLYPAVWLVNTISNGLLRLFGVSSVSSSDNLSREELRTVVSESGSLITRRHKNMLLSILDLESVTIDDIMVPKHEIIGIDLDDDIDTIINTLRNAQHTRLPVYKGDLNAALGILHLRKVTRFLNDKDLNKATIMQQVAEPYFVPESTQLSRQMINFQQNKRRVGFVVDEYGDIQGLVTLEDILEEIVGEFTTDLAATNKDIHPQEEDGFYIIDGSAHIRDINKALKWQLPTNGPKTLSGLITEHLESIPESHLCITIGQYRIETKQIKRNLIKNALVHKAPDPEED